uniref:N-acetyltransferase domain-containing protein n=1 Tax=Bionectria ochroleuca TaxID=29856 RepID=A0A8H7KBN6_BIOOC
MGKTRIATQDDVPAIAKLIQDSIQKDRLWLRFSASKSVQDEAYSTEIESLLEEHLYPSMEDWIVEVVDLGESEPVIVSAAIWDVKGAQGPEVAKREHKTYIRDRRLLKYIEILRSAQDKSSPRYPRSTWLQLLVTHPNHQGRGYAKDLVNSQVSRSKKEGGVLAAIGGARHTYSSADGDLATWAPWRAWRRTQRRILSRLCRW